jgi:hypothetical protein
MESLRPVFHTTSKYWSAACPHLFPFFYPFSASQENMVHCLLSLVASALAGVRLVDAVEIGPEAYLACSHLRND